jgi:cobalamin synthase
MFWQKVKSVLTKKREMIILKDFNIVDPSLIAICIIFLQNLITVEKPDQDQTISLIAFSIAIPMLAIHFFAIQTIDKLNTPVPAYLAKSFEFLFAIGWISTCVGVVSLLVRVSLIAAVALAFSFLGGAIVYINVRSYIGSNGVGRKRN